MASLYITEFRDAGSAGRQVARFPAVTHQSPVSLSASQALSAAFHADTKFIRVYAAADCFIDVGTNPAASTSKMPIATGVPEYFEVTGGHLLAAITA